MFSRPNCPPVPCSEQGLAKRFGATLEMPNADYLVAEEAGTVVGEPCAGSAMLTAHAKLPIFPERSRSMHRMLE